MMFNACLIHRRVLRCNISRWYHAKVTLHDEHLIGFSVLMPKMFQHHRTNWATRKVNEDISSEWSQQKRSKTNQIGGGETKLQPNDNKSLPVCWVNGVSVTGLRLQISRLFLRGDAGAEMYHEPQEASPHSKVTPMIGGLEVTPVILRRRLCIFPPTTRCCGRRSSWIKCVVPHRLSVKTRWSTEKWGIHDTWTVLCLSVTHERGLYK